MTAFVYLDHNATTIVRPEARAAIADALLACGNPSSVHRAGRAARQSLSAARAAVGAAINLPPEGRIVFTSGGTEANHLALKGMRRPVLRSAIEHDSVRAAVPDAAIIPVDAQGRIDLAVVERLLSACAEPPLVSVMAANNETGVLQPIAELVRVAHAAGALVHCDAIQAIGKIPFDMAALGVDLVSISAHKFGGPMGVGALAIGPGLDITALQTGGGQEQNLRAGTENLPAIAGFAAAIGLAVAELDSFARLSILRDRMEAEMASVEPEAIFVGQDARRLPNTSTVALPGMESEIQIMSLDLAGIGVSAGAACSSGKVRPSHVLAAMGLPESVARTAIRISLGRDSDDAAIDRLLTAWTVLARRAQTKRIAA
jgi:cysteine desulfurase